MKSGRIIREREPIGIRRKEFWDVSATSALLGEKFKSQLGHEPDGLVFQPIEEVKNSAFYLWQQNHLKFNFNCQHVVCFYEKSYTPGQCPSVLKWKPPSHNSVDFRLEIVIENRPG
jgi:mRNA-capping enzyme